MEMLYWHWVILGVLLVLFELVIPSFTAMWFGLSAIAVGIVLWLEPGLAGSYQIIIWIVSSGVLMLAWFRVFKPKKGHHQAVKEEVEGEVGLIAVLASGSRPGVVRFSSPLLGEDEWSYQSEQELEVGQQVKVLDVENNILIVVKRA